MKKKSIITLVLLLAIGFAAVSTTLIVNGTIGIGTNNDNFVDGVVFDEESLSSSEGTTAEISESGRTITFTTQEMKSIDETATITFKIKNYSQYDAVLGTPAVACYFVDDHQTDVAVTPTPTTTTHEYMTVTPGTELDGKTIAAGGGLSDESSITVKQKKSYVGDNKQTVKFQCVINATAGESENSSVDKEPTFKVTFDTNRGNVLDTTLSVKYGKAYGELPIPTKTNYEFLGWYTATGEKVESTSIVNLQENHTLIAKWNPAYDLINDNNNNGVIDVGDEIAIGEEHFYVISNDNTKINALAKYNLKVGNIYNSDDTKESTIQANEEGYGKQDLQMRGWNPGEKSYGTIKFSKANGWEYTTNATIDIRNEAYRVGEGVNAETMTALDALYGENGYENYIKQTINNARVRLITKGEIEGLINNGSALSYGDSITSKANNKGYSWLYSTTYWTQTSYSGYNNLVWRVDIDGGVRNSNFEHDLRCGVRPVVEIPLS